MDLECVEFSAPAGVRRIVTAVVTTASNFQHKYPLARIAPGLATGTMGPLQLFAEPGKWTQAGIK